MLDWGPGRGAAQRRARGGRETEHRSDQPARHRV